MDLIHRASSIGRYLLNAQSHQRIHSPFVFEFYKEVLYNKRDFLPYIEIEKRRHQLIRDLSVIDVCDFGAGGWKTSKRRVNEIAKTSLKRKKYAQILYRIARYFQPESTLELGTSLGITTAYLSCGYPEGQVYTIEGCPNIGEVARETFEKLQLKNIHQYIGNFDDILPKVMDDIDRQLGVVFIDGNHRLEPTLRYFETTLEKSGNDTVFIFDDIYWSDEMEEAWQRLKLHPKTTITIDLYEMGIVFIRKEQKEKEHFVIRY
jgi:predicted O-methyltransferase YrrM